MLGQTLFKKNRKKFGDRLGKGTIALAFSGRQIPRSNDDNYPFFPNNNYYYLTGLTEPEGLVTIYKDNEGNVSERLFIPRRDADREKWSGPMYTKNQASRISGMTSIFYEDEALDYIHEKLAEGAKLGIDHSQLLSQWYYYGDKDAPEGTETTDTSSLFMELRLIKEPEEIEAIREAIDITAKGLNEILSQIHPGMKEYELAALFEYIIKKNGSEGVSFDTIAASGPNATTLHHTRNDGIMGRNDLILFDLGAAKDRYRADVSRTYPVSGKVTLFQERFYNAVLNAQKRIIKLYKAGAKMKDVQEETKKILEESLAEQGIGLPEGGIQEWYYHNIGHSLGLDTHDVSGKELELKDGMVVTCEPGLYAKEHGIGVRIEDDILINGDEPIVLTEKIPKDLREIMRLIN